jgi:NAD(P)-dependent dehydrogenase (short-subunit alcohol dehydrogenase family)
MAHDASSGRPPRVVVITGGSAGVGRAAALAIARRGDWVAVLARDAQRVEATCIELRAAGATALGIAADVADAAEVERAADRLERELGVISVWVNNAMATVYAPVSSMTAMSSGASPMSRTWASCMARSRHCGACSRATRAASSR